MSTNERQVEYFTQRMELDLKTDYTQHKKNRFNRPVKAIRIGLASSPSVIIKAKFKEGDELILWPGRIVNLSVMSAGVVFSWEGQVNEWVEVEISDNADFVSGDYRPLDAIQTSLPSSFRKSKYDLTDTAAIQILSVNTLRTSATIYNPNPRPIEVGSQIACDPADGSGYQKAMRIMPFTSKEIKITGELWAIADNAFIGTNFTGNYHRIFVEEFLK